MMSDLDKVIEKHDAAVAAGGVEIWIGAEPTFTLRKSEAPEWLSQALGGEKEDYALRMARELSVRHPGSVILRSVGRQYGGEERPRWSIGLYERRDGVAVWNGPPDPVFAGPSTAQAGGAQRFRETLARAFTQRRWQYRVYPAGDDMEQCLLVRMDGKELDGCDADDPRLCRGSVHDEKTPDSGLCDNLAGEGFFLFAVGEVECAPGITTVRV
ncbi:MAG: transglutaminase family protein, partial [Gammaproteobacteria bacterium]|nr:transglutaminase family protein [Gammaproteobacteria bacterium]